MRKWQVFLWWCLSGLLVSILLMLGFLMGRLSHLEGEVGRLGKERVYKVDGIMVGGQSRNVVFVDRDGDGLPEFGASVR